MKISVVVPVYNVEQYIVTSLKSLESQTIFQDLKIILVDDSSTDQSYQICQQFFEKHPANVVLLKNSENKGVSYTRNRGLREVDTEYVTFFDPDDVLSENMYEELLKTSLNDNADVAISSIFTCCQYSEIEDKSGFNVKQDYIIFNNEEALEAFYKCEYIDNSTVNKLFRYSVIEGIEFDESLKIAEDMLFVYMALKKSERIVLNLSDWGYFYLRRQSSAMSTTFNDDYKYSLEVLKTIKKLESKEALLSILEVKELYDKALIIKVLIKNKVSFEILLKDFRENFINIDKCLLFKTANLKQLLIIVITFVSPRFCSFLISMKKKLE